MAGNRDTEQPAPRRKRGFERAAGLLKQPIRKAAEKRGFAETRVLTHWAETVGPEVAAIARPVSISYSKGGFGATLTVLTTGAQAPLLQMQEPQLRERINAIYGHNAIARLRFTQTAPTGFAEGQAHFGPPPKPARRLPDAACREAASDLATGVGDDALRRALEDLGADILNRSRKA